MISRTFFIDITYTSFPPINVDMYALDAPTALAKVSLPPLVLLLDSCLANSLYFFPPYYLRYSFFFLLLLCFAAEFHLLHAAPLVKETLASNTIE